MPTYCTPLLDLAEAERILSLVVQSDPYTPFGPEDMVTGDVKYPGPIPDKVDTSGLHISEWMVTGNYARKKGDFEIVRRILEEGSDPALLSVISVSQSFESKREKQTRGRCEEISIQLKQGKSFFGYSSTLCLRRELWETYALYLEELIQCLSLPARVVRNVEGFQLEHTQGGELWNGSSGAPRNISCEVPGASHETLAVMMKETLERFGSGTEFGSSWTLIQEDFQHQALEPNIVELIRAKALPAKRTELMLGTVLPEVRDIERLRGLTAGGGIYEIVAGDLFLKEQSLAEVEVEIWPGGYVITFENSGSSSRIEKLIGIPLSRANQRKPESEE